MSVSQEAPEGGGWVSPIRLGLPEGNGGVSPLRLGPPEGKALPPALLLYFPALQPETTGKLQSWTQEMRSGRGRLTHLAQPGPTREKVPPAAPPTPKALFLLFRYPYPGLHYSAVLLEENAQEPLTPAFIPKILWAEPSLQSGFSEFNHRGGSRGLPQ